MAQEVFESLWYFLLYIQNRDGQLQNRGKTHPKQIGDLHIKNPFFFVREDDFHCPQKRYQNEENINCGEKIILQSKLNRAKDEIEKEIERKRKRGQKWDFFLKSEPKNPSKRKCNEDIENCPNRSKEPRRRRPRRSDEFRIPSVCKVHKF